MLLQPSCLLLCLSTVLLWRGTESGYIPQSSPSSSVGYAEQGRALLFPDFSGQSSSCTPDDVSYFISEQNFDAVSGNILVGAANKLYLLSDSLQCQSDYQWDATTGNEASCVSDNVGSVQASTCQNHVRVYKTVPSDPTLVLACGTQASVSPECRILRITNTSLTETTQASVPATDAFVSYYPELSGFGEFTRSPNETSNSFFAAGFFRGTRGVGRDYKMAVYNVTSAVTGTLSVTESFSTLVDENWLKPPITFVDYNRADYDQPLFAHIGRDPLPDHYHFYFVFLRENLVGVSGYEIIYSRVVRICRNDPGVDGHFSTYMKARIYCEREVPPGRQFIGSLDYQYNNIESVAFNTQGRFSENGDWFKTMYGAFSGARIGPEGTAICAYPADNSLATGAADMGYNRGIFDIFREDLSNPNPSPDGTDGELQNDFLECDRAGRDSTASNLVQIVQDVKQIGEDPLLVLDGITVTQMVVDMACVVTSSNSGQCKNQDVLFLGTDIGTVIKVVFATLQTEITPVIAETINLDDGGEVHELRIETVGTEKFIYASTDTRIYRLPLERCSRFQTCSDCVGSQDPYCVWDSNMNGGRCVRSTLSVAGDQTVNIGSGIWQNIHTGAASQCNSVPECTVTATALGHSDVMCEVQCNNTASVTFSTSDVSLTRTDCQGSVGEDLTGGGEACVRFTGGSGLQSYQCIVSTTSTSGAGPKFTDTITTPAGPPVPVSLDQILYVCSKTTLRVCLQLDLFTDSFDNYLFKVQYGTAALESTSDEQRLNQGSCLTISNLDPGSNVLFKLNISNNLGSEFSSVISHQLLEDVPEAVTALMSSAKTSRTVTLTWQPPLVTNGNITGYTILVGGIEEITCVLQPSQTYTVDGLLPFTEYRFEVQACTEAGEGPMSTALTVTTECEAPGVVNAISFSDITANSLSVEWTLPGEVNGDPNGLQYQVNIVCFDPKTGLNSNPTTGTINTTSRNISGIQPLTYCCATVSANHSTCSDSTSGPSKERCARTLDTQPEVVRNFQLEVVGPTSIFAIWDTPVNYQRPGLTYTLSISLQGDTESNPRTETVTDLTYFLIGGLTPNTLYFVSIMASTVKNTNGGSVSLSNSTSPLPPSTPINPSFSLSASSENLTISWGPPVESDTRAPVIDYTTSVRCNNFQFPPEMSTATMVVFNVSQINGLAWCTAVVQARNMVGYGDYSAQANTIIPATVPTKPRCYFTDNSGANASISYTVTYPFSLNQASVNWTLYRSNQLSTMGVSDFNSNSTNVVYVPVERESSYHFQLRFCNENGCGDYCDMIEFTTTTNSPSPPEVITSDNDCCSANVSWPLPPDEVEGTISYTIQLTSSCSRANIMVQNINERWYLFSDLCAGTEYSVAIKVTVLQSNITGVYSRPYVFNTEAGTPSEVRSIKPTFGSDDKGVINALTVSWAVPQEPNGTIELYEVQWSDSSVTSKCDQPDGNVFYQNVTEPQDFELKTTNVSNIENAKSLLVCVRAYTGSQAGIWGAWRTADVSIGGLIGSNTTCAEPCPNLIVVAVIASFAVLSSIVLGVVLVLVMCYNGWSPLKDMKDNRKKEEEDDFHNHQYTHAHKKVAYNKTHSLQSTSSQAPMLNGTS